MGQKGPCLLLPPHSAGVSFDAAPGRHFSRLPRARRERRRPLDLDLDPGAVDGLQLRATVERSRLFPASIAARSTQLPGVSTSRLLSAMIDASS